MNNDIIIKQVKQHIEELKNERKNIDISIKAAEQYLNVLLGEKHPEAEPKANQTEEAREKMRKSQQERQARLRKLRMKSITDFLKRHGEANLQQIAHHLDLKETATKRYLRASQNFHEVGINVWAYEPDADIPF